MPVMWCAPHRRPPNPLKPAVFPGLAVRDCEGLAVLGSGGLGTAGAA